MSCMNTRKKYTGPEKCRKRESDVQGSALIITLAVCSMILIMGALILELALSGARFWKRSAQGTELFYRLEGAVDETGEKMELVVEQEIAEAYGEALLYICRNMSCSNEDVNACFAESAFERLKRVLDMEETDSSFPASPSFTDKSEREKQCIRVSDQILTFTEPWEDGSFTVQIDDIFLEFGYEKGEDSRLILDDVTFCGKSHDSGETVSVTLDYSIRIPYFIFLPEEEEKGKSGFEGDFVIEENWRTGPG